MRKDMFKVIVERPRSGAGFPVNRSRLAGEDDLPTRVGMKRFRTLNRTSSKWLNENLAPLKRYLMKQVGRPWTKVYSEICENLDANNAVQQHVRDHLQDFIVVKVAIGRDRAWMNGNDRCGWRCGEAPWRQKLYVDPKDGIIKRSDKLWKKLGIDATPSWKRKPIDDSRADPFIRKIDASTELHCINGVWYEIRFRTIANADPAQSAFDKLKRKLVWPGERHAYDKRQLSAANLAVHGLANDTD